MCVTEYYVLSCGCRAYHRTVKCTFQIEIEAHSLFSKYDSAHPIIEAKQKKCDAYSHDLDLDLVVGSRKCRRCVACDELLSRLDALFTPGEGDELGEEEEEVVADEAAEGQMAVVERQEGRERDGEGKEEADKVEEQRGGLKKAERSVGKAAKILGISEEMLGRWEEANQKRS